MRKLLLNIFYLLCLFTASGQVPVGTTRVSYYENKECYFFNLSTSNQTLYFDSVIYDNERPITILFKNDTKDTVFLKIKSLQSVKQIFTEKSSRYLHPGEHYAISPKFNTTRFDKQSLLNSFFECYYHRSSTSIDQHFVFRLQGNIELDSLPDFEESLFAEVDIAIAKKSAPSDLNILVIKDQGDTIKKILSSEIAPDSLRRFYFYTQNVKEFIPPIDSFGTYKYHVYLHDLSKIGLNAESLWSYLRSEEINVSIKKPGKSILTNEKNDFLILLCKQEDIKNIKTLLKGCDIHLIIDSYHDRSTRFLDDTYDVYFSSELDWSVNDVKNFLKSKGITKYEGIRKTKDEFPSKYSYFVKVTLDNKHQHSDQELINSLIKTIEIAWITSGRTKYTVLD